MIATSCQVSVGSQATMPKATPATRLTATGRAAPKRSDRRPASGDTADSSAEAHKKVAAMTALEAPSRANRSGASTLMTPKAIPASIISPMPATSRWSRSAAGIARRPSASELGGATGSTDEAAISTALRTAAAENAGPVPTAFATAPTIGPNSAPTIAAASATPSSSPRRDSGAFSASQASPAAHVHAPASPWTSRAASINGITDVQPKASVARLISASPSTATRRAPNRATSSPPGIEPTRVPAG
jgi:hypothetical protein